MEAWFSARVWALSARNLELLSTLDCTDDVAMLKSLSPMMSLFDDRSCRSTLLFELFLLKFFYGPLDGLPGLVVLTIPEFAAACLSEKAY